MASWLAFLCLVETSATIHGRCFTQTFENAPLIANYFDNRFIGLSNIQRRQEVRIR